MDIDELYDKIYRFCYFRVRNRELAEDLTQEAFLRFFEIDSYVNQGKAMQYLYTIARNLCIDEYRKKPVIPLDEQQLEMALDDDMSYDLSVKMALEGLAETDRELLLLRYANDTPVSVIAGIYEISRFAVRRRLIHAENELRKKLGEGGLV